MSDLYRRRRGEDTFDFLGSRKNTDNKPETEAPADEEIEDNKEDRDNNEDIHSEEPSEREYNIRPDSTERKKKQPAEKKTAAVFDVKKLIVLAAAIFVAAVFIVSCSRAVIGRLNGKPEAGTVHQGGDEQSGASGEAEDSTADEETDIVSEAALRAEQYDYDTAIELLQSMPGYDSDENAQSMVKEYEDTKATLVEQDIYKITHVFFHILCVDPENAFDKSKWGKQADGYNSLMTTIGEFEKMMQEMYDDGFVLVSLRDIAKEEVQEDGSVKMVKQSIMLPPGKKAFVMSEDDVCYYEYMKGAGFSDKMVVGDDGRPVNHYIDEDGNEFTGDYDLVPILDRFIDEHPDFSYKGHKACIVFTGYNGILGYRTDESYDPSSEYYDPSLEHGHDVSEERKEAVEVLKALDADGYDLGSHSWGHRDMGEIDMERFKKDCDRWNRNVASLIKEATGEQPDIIIFPRGADIADWHAYTSENARFNYMYDLGFRYFCNVDNNQYWVQLGDTYMRQGRRALDGYNMWLQISGQNNRLSDLFENVSVIFDKARPTPVPSY